MSVQSEINRISGNVAAALEAIAAKGVSVGNGSNSDDLATLIAAIEAGGGESSGGLNLGDFLKIDEIYTGSVVPAVKEKFTITRPSLNHEPRLCILYSEDDVRTISGSYYTTLFAFAMSNATDVRSNTESTFTIQIGSSMASAPSSTLRTAFETYKEGYGFGAASVYNVIYSQANSTTVTVYPMNGSTTSSSKKYFAVGANYKYLIGYEVKT